MKNADMPAGTLRTAHEECKGMTKREHFAAMAMQAIINGNMTDDVSHDDIPDFMRVVASYSVISADALLAELERTK